MEEQANALAISLIVCFDGLQKHFAPDPRDPPPPLNTKGKILEYVNGEQEKTSSKRREVLYRENVKS